MSEPESQPSGVDCSIWPSCKEVMRTQRSLEVIVCNRAAEPGRSQKSNSPCRVLVEETPLTSDLGTHMAISEHNDMATGSKHQQLVHAWACAHVDEILAGTIYILWQYLLQQQAIQPTYSAQLMIRLDNRSNPNKVTMPFIFHGMEQLKRQHVPAALVMGSLE
eukprot:350436-Chlamydomonas_euryale.AAC.18